MGERMSGIFLCLTAGMVGLGLAVQAGTANATPVRLDEPTLACAIDYDWKQVEPSRFLSQVKIRNTGAAVINAWTLRFTLPEPQRVVLYRNARFETFSGPIVAHNIESNGVVEPGNTVAVGFHANGTGMVIHDFTVNGTACAAADE